MKILKPQLRTIVAEREKESRLLKKITQIKRKKEKRRGEEEEGGGG